MFPVYVKETVENNLYEGLNLLFKSTAHKTF